MTAEAQGNLRFLFLSIMNFIAVIPILLPDIIGLAVQ